MCIALLLGLSGGRFDLSNARFTSPQASGVSPLTSAGGEAPDPIRLARQARCRVCLHLPHLKDYCTGNTLFTPTCICEWDEAKAVLIEQGELERYWA
jgi:hypothetical protein